MSKIDKITPEQSEEERFGSIFRYPSIRNKHILLVYHINLPDNITDTTVLENYINWQIFENCAKHSSGNKLFENAISDTIAVIEERFPDLCKIGTNSHELKQMIEEVFYSAFCIERLD